MTKKQARKEYIMALETVVGILGGYFRDLNMPGTTDPISMGDVGRTYSEFKSQCAQGNFDAYAPDADKRT